MTDDQAPEQLSRAALRSMTHRQITEAKRAGQLRDLLSGKAPTDPTEGDDAA